ncbi:DgyrCDS6102 [Dimorphilus gyrociliatus]|uniref:DgyrCDS6102 n=1 Tax=Dimorphilus gyrociliatus TaxID=2664684 RepID=A0A7I8VPU8_9ANNE|nr:DgyrCDS6102 [Dimorphilus gyrociliatus]
MAVREIYEELKVEKYDSAWKLKILLEPRVNHDEQKNVCAQVVIDLSAEYPNEKPQVSFETSRGLSDERLSFILENLQSFLELRIGHPVIFDLLQHLIDYLDSNLPCTPCLLCLDHFNESNRVFKTECFHFFHASCFIRYVKHQEREKKTQNTKQRKKENPELLCPICRLKILYNEELSNLMESNTLNSEEDVIFKPTEGFINWKRQQEKLWPIYLKQKRKGGIINVKENKTKYLIKADTIITKKHDENGDSNNKNTVKNQTRQRNKSTSTNFKDIGSNCNVSSGMQRRKSFPFILSTIVLESNYIEHFFSANFSQYDESTILSETEIYRLKHSTSADKTMNTSINLINEQLKRAAANNRKTSQEMIKDKRPNKGKTSDSYKQFSNFRGSGRNLGSRRKNYSRSQKPHYNKTHDNDKTTKTTDAQPTEEFKGKQYELNSVTGRGKRHFYTRHNHNSGQGRIKASQACYPTNNGRNSENDHREESRGGQRAPRSTYRGRARGMGRARNDRKFNKDVTMDKVKN